MDLFENHADLCKRHRMDIMDEYLASIGRKRKPIPKDGSSLFRAVSEQLFSTQQRHIVVREACVKHMEMNRAEFEHFVDDPFDEYLDRMYNPKESGDQIEISALSQLYKHDFHIYEQPGQPAKNVTENLFDKVVHLCHSGQKHYDCVYPVEFFSVYGLCQSIVNSVLLRNVLNLEEEEESKIVSTFRMLCSSDTDHQSDKKSKNLTSTSQFPFPSIYEPSIGVFDKMIPAEQQLGLAFKLPVSLDFARSLDPFVYRNIDYDFWITIKRRQQFIDFSISEGLQYCIGDRCCVFLNIYSKPLIGHVQEVSPDHGPITVFIEDLGEMHSIAVKNIKPIDLNTNGVRMDRFWCRPKRFSNEEYWNPRNRRYQKSPKKGLKADRSASSNLRNNNADYVSTRALQHADGVSNRKYGGGKKNLKSPMRKNKQNKDQSSTEFHCSSKSSLKCESKVQLDPTPLLHDLSLNSFNDETSLSPVQDKSEMPYPISHYPSNLKWEEEEESSGFSLCYDTDYNHVMHMSTTSIRTDQVSEAQYWSGEKNPCTSYSCEQSSKDEFVDNEIHEEEVSTSLPGYVSGNTQVSDHEISLSNTTADSAVVLQENTEDSSRVPVLPYAASEGFIPYYPSFPPSYPCGPPPNVPSPRGNGVPYSGAVTMFDCEVKEMVWVDEKDPFQYFYNLGLEYYRQLNMGNPRGSVGFGSPVYPSNAYGSPPPIIQSHPVGYFPSPATPPMVAPVVQPSPCVALPHFHSVVASPPGGMVHFSGPPPGRMLVHVPPAAPPPSTVNYPSTTESSTCESAIRVSSSYHEESYECVPDLTSSHPRSMSFDPQYTPVMQNNPNLNQFVPVNYQSGVGVVDPSNGVRNASTEPQDNGRLLG